MRVAVNPVSGEIGTSSIEEIGRFSSSDDVIGIINANNSN